MDNSAVKLNALPEGWDKYSDELRNVFTYMSSSMSQELPVVSIDIYYFILAIMMHRKNDAYMIIDKVLTSSAIEDIYNAYTAAKSQYENYENMYQYTNTPNEGLKNFIEELEEKMPSDITVESFSSTGTQVSFSMRVTSKSAAANTIIQLRTFESLATVTTTGIDEAEDGTVSLSVLCTYSDPAPLDSDTE